MKVEKIQWRTPKGFVNEIDAVEILKGKFKSIRVAEEFMLINQNEIVSRNELEIGLDGRLKIKHGRHNQNE